MESVKPATKRSGTDGDAVTFITTMQQHDKYETVFMLILKE
jgi:hypothetical protein